MSRELKKEYIKIAKDLCYGKAIINRIKNATSEHEVVRIMHDARLSTNY